MFGRTRHHDTREAGGTAVADRDDETEPLVRFELTTFRLQGECSTS